MAKKSKLKTPDWVLEGFDSEADYNKSKGIKVVHRFPRDDLPKREASAYSKVRNSGAKKSDKTFKIRKCHKCNSDEVEVVIGEVGVWECKKCKWKGEDVKQEELNEKEFMKYLDERGEEVA